MTMEIITKANNIIHRIGLNNDNGQTVVIYPSKLNKKNTTYKTKNGVKKTPFYQFVLNVEIIQYFGFNDYVYFTKKDDTVYITPTEARGNTHRAKINARRQVLLPKKFFDLDGKTQVILKLEMTTHNKNTEYATEAGILTIEII